MEKGMTVTAESDLKSLRRLLTYTPAHIIVAAVNLGVFDALELQPQTSDNLAVALGTDADGMKRLLRVLAKLKLLDYREGCYENTPASSRYLVSQSSGFLRGIVAGINLWSPFWLKLDTSVREGRPVGRDIYGETASPWEAIYRTPASARQFLDAMDEESRPWAEDISDYFDWTEKKHLVEIGAGSGQNALKVLQRYSHMKATLVDLPAATPYTQEFVARSPAGGRARVVTGDFFVPESLPHDGDVYLLSWILHNWSDSQANTILSNVFEAMPVGAGVLISELLLPDDEEQTNMTVEASLSMLLYFGGRERALGEYVSMLREAGFVDVETLVPSAGKGLIYGRKP